jgi:tetratricopeptide (TPR) repeat protein
MNIDNFEKLFGEKRPPSNHNREIKIDTDVHKLINSSWHRNWMQGLELKDDDHLKAITFLNKAIQENPNHSNLWRSRASIKQDYGDYNGSIDDYKRVLILGSDWYVHYFQLGYNFIRLQDFKKGLIALDISIKLKEEMYKYTHLGPYYFLNIVKRVDSEVLYNNRAIAKQGVKDFKGALEDTIMSTKINPQYSNAYYVRSLCYLLMKEKEKAFNMMKKAAQKGHLEAIADLRTFFPGQ